MGFDLKKCIDAAVMPVVALIVLDFIFGLLNLFVPTITSIVAILAFLVNITILGWAGYKAFREGGITASLITGLIAGGVSMFIIMIIDFALSFVGIKITGYGLALILRAILVSMISPRAGIVFSVAMIIFYTIYRSILGAVFGLIGGAIAMMKGTGSPSANATPEKK